jgi:hypothetical protein
MTPGGVSAWPGSGETVMAVVIEELESTMIIITKPLILWWKAFEIQHYTGWVEIQ